MFPTPPSPFDADRFLRAQADVLGAIERELGGGRKTSHWMWFAFPQLRGLGRSPTAERFALDSLAQARAYLDHPTLGARLRRWTRMAIDVPDRSAHDIFGSPDDLKFHSSMTLFDRGEPGGLFDAALVRFHEGRRDRRTLALLAAEKGA